MVDFRFFYVMLYKPKKEGKILEFYLDYYILYLKSYKY